MTDSYTAWSVHADMHNSCISTYSSPDLALHPQLQLCSKLNKHLKPLLTLYTHLHNSFTSYQLPGMLLHHLKQQKTVWRSWVMTAVQWITLFLLNKSSQNKKHHVTDLGPLPHNYILTRSASSSQNYTSILQAVPIFLFILLILFYKPSPQSIHNFIYLNSGSITHDRESIRVSARLPSESFPIWGNMQAWPT